MASVRRSHKKIQKGEGFRGQRIVVLPRRVVAEARKQPLLNGLVLTDIGFFPRAEGHLRERFGGIDQAIFIYCTNGTGWCETVNRFHSVKAGDLLVLPPGLPHTYGADKIQPWSIYWFHAEGALLDVYLRQLDAGSVQPVKHIGDAQQVRALFEEAMDDMEHGYHQFQMFCATQTMAHLIAVLVREHRRDHPAQPDIHQKITQTIAYMKQHLNQALQLNTLATLANLSRSRYAELFKQQFGYAPIDYFIRLRMHHACQLLDTTDLSIKAIAIQLGYEDPLYFSRLFRAVNEKSPIDYRKLRKG